MKKLIYLLAMLLPIMATQAKADAVSVAEIETTAGGSADIIISFSTTATNYTGYQMSLYLPEGVTLQKDEDDDYLYTLSSRHNKNHVFSVNQQADGGLMLVCYSMTKKTIAAGDGELLRLPVNIASTATSSRQGSISGVVFSDTSGKTYQANNALVNFTISEPVAPPAQSLIGGTVPELVAYYHGVDNAPYVTDFIEVDQTVLASLATTNADWSFGTWTNDATNRDKIGAAGTSAGSEFAWTVSSIAPYTVYFYDASKRLLNSNPGYFSSSNIGQVKYIKISVDCSNFRLYLDGETYRQSIKAVDVNTNYPIAELSVAVKKVMPGMPVTWEEFLAVNSPINNGVFNFYPIAPGNDYTALCSTNWTADTYGNYFATTGTTVGVNFNEVFNSRYIGANSFTYTPDDSYNIVASSGYKEQLGLPNTFKMYVGRAAWDNVDETWVDRVYSFGSTENNRYNLTKTTGWGDEFDLISHTLASSATQHTTKITYTYPSVSTRIENGRWVVADNYEVNDASYTYKTYFVDPFAKPVQSMLKKGSYMYSFSTQYGVAPNASGIELQYFKLTGQYDSEAPYTDNLKNMLANGIWKINGNVTIIGDNGIMYYNILNASTIATDGTVKIANKFSDEAGRPSSTVTQTLTIPLVNILGGTYNFTFSFMMSSTGGSTPEKTEQTLSLNELPTMTVGDATYTLPAKTTEGLTLTWSSSNTAVATVAGNVLTVVGAGTSIITASQAGNNTYKAFTRQFTLTVNEAAPSIDVTDISTLTNAIYVNSFNARVGESATMEICLKNAEAATAYVFDLVLPEGITVAKNEKDKYIDALSDRHDDHTRTFNYKGNNTYSLATLSGNSELLTGNDGTIRILTLEVADDMAEGSYVIEIKNASYSTPTGYDVMLPETKALITVEDYILGDVNGNDRIDIGDAVSVVNHLVGKESTNFVEKAADTNKNGRIDIGDAVTIVNVLVGKATSFSRTIGAEQDEKEPQ